MTFHLPTLFSWRQQYNPLRSLTISRVAFYLEQAERGCYSDIQWIYRYIEKRDATLRALVERRTSAVGKLDWDIKVRAVGGKDPKKPDAKAKAQMEALKGAYEMVDNLREAIDFMCMAEFRGYSHLEKHFNADGDVFHLEPVPQWFWARRMPNTNWLYNKLAQSAAWGVPIDRRNFIVRSVERPIDEVAIIAFMRKNLGQKDWDAYVETYGLPPLFIELPQNAPPSLQAAYQDMAERVIGDMRGTLPSGAKVQTVTADRAINPFKEHIEYQDMQMVLAGTGGKLTMLNDPTGLGSGQSEAHQETFDQIAAVEAKKISECFQKQFDAYVLNSLFPGEEHVVYFDLAAKDEEDVSQLVDNVSKLSSAGYVMAEDQLSEKTGYQLTRQQQDMGMGMGQEEEQFQFRNRNGKHIAESHQLTLAKAVADDLSHVTKRVEEILKIEDESLRNRKLAEIDKQFPSFLRDINRDPAAAEPLRRAMALAFSEGATKQ